MKQYQNYYESKFEQLIASGSSIVDAVQAVSHCYLDGKPRHIGKHSSVAVAQHAQFWSCNFLYTLTTKEFELTPFILALSRYMNQEKNSQFQVT